LVPALGAKIIEEARACVGSHYINGAYGGIPGTADVGVPLPMPRRITLVASPDRLDLKLNLQKKSANLAVFAAEMNIKDYCVCAGNYNSFPGGRGADPSNWDVNNYLESLRGKDVVMWPNYYGRYTPRRVFGPGATPGSALNGVLVWGESCRGIRHFDCVGFISYCFWKATGKIYQFEIKAWHDVPNPVGAQVFELKSSKPASLLDGDILIRANHHIAYTTRDGKLIEAQDTDLGVRESEGNFSLANVGTWTHLVRLP
jgi:hypothetical protein